MSADVLLVTGSSGLIGSAVVKRFAGDFMIVGFDRETSPHPPAEAECVCADLASEESVREAFARLRYGYGPRAVRAPPRPRAARCRPGPIRRPRHDRGS